MSRLSRLLAAGLAASCGLVPLPSHAAQEPPLSALTLTGPERTLFSATRDACDGADVPDARITATGPCAALTSIT